MHLREDLEIAQQNYTATAVHSIEISQKQIYKHLRKFFEKGQIPLCDDLTKIPDHLLETSNSLVRYHYRFNCEEMYTGGRGTGNWLWFLYSVRQAAYRIGNVQVRMDCVDAAQNKSSLIVPWVMGNFAAHLDPHSSVETACQTTWEMKGRILDDIRYELQRMAVSMMGVPHANHPAAKFIVDEFREKALQLPTLRSPLLEGIEIDDVAIHFRCGDLLEKKQGPEYGYAKFTSLVEFISEEARSIGIIAQPFQGQIRKNDRKDTGRCAILVGALQSFLRHSFPRANVTIRNSPSETIALAFTRLIMANESVAAGTSTFIAMPFYAAFGTAYQVDRKEMIANSRIYDLWREPDGKEKILSLLTDNSSSSL